jgi:predicted Zn-dependent protease with MMP-like domain
MDNLHVVVETGRRSRITGDGPARALRRVNLHDRASGYSGFLPTGSPCSWGPTSSCGCPAAVAAQIRKTVLHEVAHHLGIDDTRLDELGY